MSGRIKSFAVAFLCLALALGVASCSKEAKKQAQKDVNGETDVDEANVKKGVKPEADAQAAVIDTDFGRIVIELYPNVAPKMVERFKQLANEGFYNGTTIHRIIPESLIQGGDPNSKDNDPANDGAGDSPYPNVPAEFSDLHYERGVVGAARKGNDNNSANCQFFITLSSHPDFERPDNRYTVFGRVIEGIGNADIISTAPVTPETDHPADKIVVKSVTLVPRSNFK
jgi:peptidyl-prolyl cis-trans isomerase B (cyclophilin B)